MTILYASYVQKTGFNCIVVGPFAQKTSSNCIVVRSYAQKTGYICIVVSSFDTNGLLVEPGTFRTQSGCVTSLPPSQLRVLIAV